MNQVSLDIQVDADKAVLWRDGSLYLLDQRCLPADELFVRCETAAQTARAISNMVVRGAPAIGVAAAFGAVLAARESYRKHPDNWKEAMEPLLLLLAEARPTAVNLAWALQRMRVAAARLNAGDPEPSLLEEADRVHQEDIQANHRIGAHGASLIEESTAVITHCNAGALATGGYGTALGVIRSAFAQGKIQRVYADETRPWLQGARLTAWELARDNIPVSLMVEGAAAALMSRGSVGWVIVGSDRIAANGDVANKIGTYSLAVAARYHGVGFMVAAPTSTIDMEAQTGAQIPIENRAADEVLCCSGQRVAAQGVDAWNPVFDVTPAELVDAIVTEKGIIRSPNAKKLADHMS